VATLAYTHRWKAPEKGAEVAMIVDDPSELLVDDVFCRLPEVAPPARSFLKLEALNQAGSIKLKPAVGMIDGLERAGRLSAGSEVIESSSGNLGVALAVICAARGYRFCCVTDPNASPTNVSLIRAMGGEVVVIDEPDSNGGYLANRIAYIERRSAENPDAVWVNQYANPDNKSAHHTSTARHLTRAFPDVSTLFVPAGTTGTLMGCAEFLRQHAPWVRVVAVDTVGSVTFGGPPGPRYLPGMGTSRPPELLDTGYVDALEMVPEEDAVGACRAMHARRGWLFGASTGSVVAAMRRWAGVLPRNSVAIGLSPDFGDRYCETVYADAWADRYLPGWREAYSRLCAEMRGDTDAIRAPADAHGGPGAGRERV
jgi:cysteine synthase A